MTNQVVFILYSGHGLSDGSWEFYDGKLIPIEMFDIIKECSNKNEKLKEVQIVSDSCFSGRWLDNLGDYDDDKLPQIVVRCAVSGDEKARGTEYGGLFT